MPLNVSRVAIIDSNIIDYAFKERTKKVAAEILQKTAKDFTLVISEYLRFEVYRGLSMSRIPAAKDIIKAFTAYPVSREVLDVAAALTTCYECDDQTKGQRGSISDGDIIIGATAFKHKFVVITANRRDFPAPYFEERRKHVLHTQDTRPIPIYELYADTNYLNEMLRICYPSARTPTSKRVSKQV